MPNQHDSFERIARLQQVESELTRAVIKHVESEPDEETFFRVPAIQKALDAMCAAIAEAVDAETCALFFVTEDVSTEAERRIVMRAASGNFLKTLTKGRGGSEANGYAYPSRLYEIRGRVLSEQQKIIQGWPVTNQIWHLGEGRLANSNRAMNLLARSHGKRMGQGDVTNYPNLGTLQSVFRNMVAIPIFARGGATPVLAVSEEEHREFLSHYRVIGILKVENKRPQRRTNALPTKQSLIDGCPEDAKGRLRQWFGKGKALNDLAALFGEDLNEEDPDGFDLLNHPPESAHGNTIKEKKRKGAHPDPNLIDYLTEVFDAQFTQEDAELLVSLAMQLGRILARRTIEHAAQHDIVISEHEVGTLNVLYRDVQQLEALFRACDSLRREVQYLFQSLKTELAYERQREIYRAQVSHRIEPREPIRQVTSRLKHPISLFRKLVNEQDELERQPVVKRLILHEVKLEVNNFGSLTEQQADVRGPSRLSWADPPHGGARARLQTELGVKGGPQATIRPYDGDTLNATLEEMKRATHLERPLVWRILNLYRVDDIAGVRVTCDYLSDLMHVLEHFYARAPGWGITIAKIDEAVEVAKEGGYRGIHITLMAGVRRLLPSEDVKRLEEALNRTKDDPLEMPCEVQLRTTLQESEALKSWGGTYKHGEDIAEKSLLELLQIHSNQLYEAEKSRDIIRDRVEAMLLPNDFGERRLLNYLRPRLTPEEGFVLVELALRCAKRIHELNLRLNGLPYLSHILATCERLVYNFGVTDPEMLFLAFLHDLWMNPCSEVKDRLLSDEGEHYDSKGFRQDLNDEIQLEDTSQRDNILGYFGARINWAERLKKFPTWFWVLLSSFRRFWHDYHKERPEDLGERQRQRLLGIRTELEKEFRRRGGGADLNDWLQRAFVLEAAILLGQLEELPDEPNRQRAEEQFRNAYEELEIITSNLPPSPIKLKVVEETTKVFQKTAKRLGVEVPINWYR